MNDPRLFESVRGLTRPLGDASRDLVLGDLRLRLEGLPAGLTRDLERRWGGFLAEPCETAADLTLRLYQAETAGWLERPRPGERYRLEARNDEAQRVVVSYHFAICPEPGARAWRLAVARDPDEPRERIVENAARYAVARMALDAGGFAMHAAAVLRDGRAWIFAGPSRSGKTTAVGLAAPAASLGDDYALVAPRNGSWHAPAVPFDNAERIDSQPPEGWFPVAGIWRLHHGRQTRVERPPSGLLTASLMGCAAFPWALPERDGELLERARRLVAEGLFAHLHFQPDSDLWPVLEPDASTGPRSRA